MKRDRGTAATEYMATIGLFLFVVVACFEAYVAFSVIEKVEEAARTGARVGSMRGASAGEAAARQVMPGWLNSNRVTVRQDGDNVECVIWAKVPVLAKGVPIDMSVTRKVEMPVGG
ncbi:TadE/TadG family type IV pilus assembly protein [Actinomadura sp. 9N407]|uniref:TadE/TadG family type IV pilus assembly protein n=1 Tax=Actinomadura sp. 9N407 TaxID=3375154 RepID=UPI0037A7278A